VAVAICAIGLAVVVGVVLRLSDPLSSPVIPAEDPYTHMALVREHLRTGTLDPLNTHETVYPPGLHAFLAAAWTYTGSDLYGLVLIGPVILGAVSILGIGILLWRTAGPVAGFVGALATAVAPEAIFRTTMMSPTALDLAILPFFLYALLRVVAGRLGWIGVAAPMALFFALAHPWLLAILCAAGLVFVLLCLVLRARETREQPTSVSGIAACIAILGMSAGVAFMMPSFGGVLNMPRSTSLPLMGLGIMAVSLAVAAGLALLVRRGTIPSRLGTAQSPLVVRLALSCAIAAILAGGWMLAARQGLPLYVDLPRMFGWPVLALAIGCIVALPFIASPVGNMGAALFAGTFPFVVFNPFHSEFLPHRTAIFLGFAMAMLAGTAAGALARWTTDALHARAKEPKAASRRSVRPLLLAAPALLIGACLAGAVYAGTPDSYPGGWYRLYNPCELDAFRDVARQADAAPQAIILVGDWESKLVLAALTKDAGRVWFTGEFFTSDQVRGDLEATMHHNGRPLIVVMDRYLRVETPDANMGFVASPPWTPMGSWCAGMGIEQPRITAFTDVGMAS